MRLYVSHDWNASREKDKVVLKVIAQLRERGFEVTLEYALKGEAPAADIPLRFDQNNCVLVFVTRNYIAKVECGEDDTKVRRDFKHASQCNARMIAICLDSTLDSKRNGPVGKLVGSQLCIEFGSGPDAHAKIASMIAKMVQCAPSTPRSAARRLRSAGRATATMCRLSHAYSAKQMPQGTQGTGAPPKAPRPHLRDRVKRIAGELDLRNPSKLHLAEIIKCAEDTLCIQHSMENDSNELSFCLRVAKLEAHLGLND
jgi:hypothetical protein